MLSLLVARGEVVPRETVHQLTWMLIKLQKFDREKKCTTYTLRVDAVDFNGGKRTLFAILIC